MNETLSIVGVVIFFTALYMYLKWRRRRPGTAVSYSSALEVLATRYARGEINREEYLQKRDDILSQRVLLECRR